jgi:hypothetical protein
VAVFPWWEADVIIAVAGCDGLVSVADSHFFIFGLEAPLYFSAGPIIRALKWWAAVIRLVACGALMAEEGNAKVAVLDRGSM